MSDIVFKSPKSVCQQIVHQTTIACAVIHHESHLRVTHSAIYDCATFHIHSIASLFTASAKVPRS